MFNKTLLGILSASVVCLGTVTAFNGDGELECTRIEFDQS